jgi:hypothetical protein
MTASDEHDPWASLADSLGLPDRPEQPAAAPISPPPARSAAPARRDPKPRQDASTDWNALANGLGLEPAAEPPKASREPSEAGVAPPVQAVQPRPAATEPTERTPEHRTADDIAARLARAERLWDDEPAGPAGRREPPADRSSRPAERRDHEPRERPTELSEEAPRPAQAASQVAREDGADEGHDGGERRRGRRRGRRGGRGRSRQREDALDRRPEQAAAEPTWRGDDAEDRRLVDTEAARDEEVTDHHDSGTVDHHPPADEYDGSPRDLSGDSRQLEGRDDREPRSRGRRRGRRGRRSDGECRDRESTAERASRPADERPASRRDNSGRDETENELEDPDLLGDESLDTTKNSSGNEPDQGSDSDTEPTRKRRRRGRRGGRRRSKIRGENGSTDVSTGEGEGGDEPTPTGYVGASAPRPQEGRRKRDGGERSTDDRSRRRGRGGRGSEERSGSRGRSRTFQPVSSSFSQDDEGLEYLGLDESDQHDASPEPRRSQGEDDAVAESGLDAVRDVPSWVEAIGIVIAGNLDARSKSPSVEAGRAGRGRPNR